MELIDVHCHLESEHFAGKLHSIIEKAKSVGVIALITCAIVPDEWELSQKISTQHKEVYFALGVHPWYISENFFNELYKLTQVSDTKYCAIGEIGLDAKTNIDMQLQKKFFEDQVAIANELGKPIIVHCRGAFNELIASLKRVGTLTAGGVIHSYSGNLEITKQLIPFGFYFSFGGAVTFRNSKKKLEVLKFIYPDYVLLETDSPDIPPVEKSGHINVPENIIYVVTAVSELIEKPQEEIARITTSNAKKLFNLKI
ncbi:MAG: TatD family hydrolase [Spirochaetes bacterium]|nr:TatD family hydrolase [Spirochaetota bacterium]